MTIDIPLGRRRTRALLALTIASVILIAALYAGAVHTEWGQRLDDAALDGRTTRRVVLDATSDLLNTISVASLVLGTAAIMLVALMRRRPLLALTAGVVIGGSVVTTEVLKRYLLERPDLVGRPDDLGMSNSFPSGHSTVAMALAVGTVLVVAKEARPIAAFCGLVYATLVGAGTVTAGWHRPSDVLGAFLVVTAWTGICVALLIVGEGAVRERSSTLARRAPSLSPFLAGVGVGLLLGAMFGAGGALVATRSDELDTVQLDATYAASVAVIAGVALLLLVTIVAALRGLSLDPPAEERRSPAVAAAVG